MSSPQALPPGEPALNHSGPTDGSELQAVERSGWTATMFTCPRCGRPFHRSFLERFWSEWQVVCWSSERRGYRLDCPLRSASPPEAVVVDTPGESAPPAYSGDGSAGTTEVLDTCLGDCALCGAHSRLGVVTSGGVLSRCLRCRDERWLDAPPPFCAHAGAGSHRVGQRSSTTGVECG